MGTVIVAFAREALTVLLKAEEEKGLIVPVIYMGNVYRPTNGKAVIVASVERRVVIEGLCSRPESSFLKYSYALP